MKILAFAAILQMVACDGNDWKTSRPVHLLAEVGRPEYTKTTEEDFELVKEPLIIRFERIWSSSDPTKRQRCVSNSDMEKEMELEHQVCFCYYSKGVSETGDYLGCGKDYAYLCSTLEYSDFDVYTSGKLIQYRNAETYKIPPFTVEEKVSDDGNIVPMIRLKKVYGGCGLIYIENVYKQEKVHSTEEFNKFWENLACPLCEPGNCDTELDDGIDRYKASKNVPAAPK
uniref:Uncharacterized protein n=1 Tax=Panagrolaimus sp. PS1159 TaxID=55785 RepID=A0AC35FWW6_9BILA